MMENYILNMFFIFLVQNYFYNFYLDKLCLWQQIFLASTVFIYIACCQRTLVRYMRFRYKRAVRPIIVVNMGREIHVLITAPSVRLHTTEELGVNYLQNYALN